MDYQAWFAARESCRKYLDQPVEHEKLFRIAEAALTAPSACNSQPWHFTVVTRPALLPVIVESSQKKIPRINQFTPECPAFIIITEQPAYVLDGQGGMKYDQKYAQVDIGLITMQLCLAATAEGLGTCIMGAFDEELLRSKIELPADGTVRLVIAIGYPAHQTVRPKKRTEIAQVLSFLE